MILNENLQESRIDMTLVLITIVILYLVCALWTWHSLGRLEPTKKIAFLILGIIMTYLITLLTFHLSKGEITYPTQEIYHSMKQLMILVFTGLNSCMMLPFLARQIDRVNEEEISREVAMKRILIFFVVILFVLWIESSYMQSTQQGILKILEKQVKAG